jgi:NTP pyrophosphatase (non-canonical NTP hydrolase)
MNKLIDFAKIETKRLRKKINCSDKEFTLFSTIKLGEEVGEVNEEILKHFKCARDEKLNNDNKLSHEIADVMIVAAILAESMNLNLNDILEEKIKINNGRWQT